MITRRSVLAGGIGLGGLHSSSLLGATTAADQLSVGVQLWMVLKLLEADLAKGLSKLAAIGVREVETAGTFGLSARGFGAVLADAGLKAVAAHSLMLSMDDEEIKRATEYYHELGVRYVVAPLPGMPGQATSTAIGERAMAGLRQPMSADVWLWNADRLNVLSERIRGNGLRLAYHNHNVEFVDYDGRTGMEILLDHTNPANVEFELDTGNARLAGIDPVHLLKAYPDRFSLVHLKAWRTPFSPRTSLDYPSSAPLAADESLPKLMAAIRDNSIKHAFLEREGIAPSAALSAISADLATLRRI